MNDFTHTFSLLFQFYYHHYYYYYQTRYFPSKIPWQRVKSHTKNPLHSTSNYPPQFRWPVNESFISNFRGGKLSCAVKFPARSQRSVQKLQPKNRWLWNRSTLIYLTVLLDERCTRAKRGRNGWTIPSWHAQHFKLARCLGVSHT